MQRFFRCFRLAGIIFSILLLLTMSGTEAARGNKTHELNYFQTTRVMVDGRDTLRIEIGMNRDNLTYQKETKSYLTKQLTVNLANTVVGNLRRHITLKDEQVNTVLLLDNGDGSTKVIVKGSNISADNCNIYTVAKDRKAKKPYRLVIDIMVPKTKNSGANVAGVEGRTIVLDAGHGGSDSGAVGPNGISEKSVTLAVTKKLEAILSESGANTVMTRTDDVDVYAPDDTAAEELQARCDVANNTPGADVFVSIHCNAFSSPAAHGMETYYYAPSASGLRLASLLNEELEQAGGLFNRGVKTANFYVIKHTNMPASLVELAFITNPKEEALLADEEYQQKLANALAKAIARFFGQDKM